MAKNTEDRRRRRIQRRSQRPPYRMQRPSQRHPLEAAISIKTATTEVVTRCWRRDEDAAGESVGGRSSSRRLLLLFKLRIRLAFGLLCWALGFMRISIQEEEQGPGWHTLGRVRDTPGASKCPKGIHKRHEHLRPRFTPGIGGMPETTCTKRR